MNDIERKRVADLAESLLWTAGVVRPPVPENAVACCDYSRSWSIEALVLNSRGRVSLVDGCWTIFVNAADSRSVRRFTVAHEAAEVLLRTRPELATYLRPLSRKERFCDAFAAAFLMPTRWIEEQWPRIRSAEQMAAIFKVSSTAMRRRLVELGLGEKSATGFLERTDDRSNKG